MPNKTWVTRGFDAFRRGTFGNAGNNLYVSRAGVLQRINLFDLNNDGWMDLVFCNAQDHWEQPPAFVYSDVFGSMKRMEVPSDGAISGVLADLNGDGFDDLVLGMYNNGIELELNAFIYFGSREGLGERYHARIPAPICTAVAAGDFNGNGRVDLAMACKGKLRIFFQSELGFEPWRHQNFDIPAEQLAAADLDGDGFADLYVLAKDHRPRIYWGGRDGIDPKRFTDLPVDATRGGGEVSTVSGEEGSSVLDPLAQIVRINDQPHLFVPSDAQATLLPVTRQRSFGHAMKFDVSSPRAVAAANLWGHGTVDLIFACGGERSWVFPRGQASRRIEFATHFACDVAAGDLDGDGRDEFVICQHREGESFSTTSLAYKVAGDGLAPPVQLPSDGARRVLIGRPSAHPTPHVVFVNQHSRNATGRIAPAIYWGGPDRFSPNHRTELSGLGAVNSIGADFNDDGRPDLLFCNCAENATDLDPGSYIFHGRDDGFRSTPDLTLPTANAMGIAVGDINRDGFLDVIVSSFSKNEVLIFFGNKDGFDTKNPQRIVIEADGVQYPEGRRMCLADLNNDGWLDLVLTFIRSDRTFILWGGPDGFSFERKQTLSIVRPSTPIVCDLTGNGYLDLLIGGHKRSEAGPHDSFVYIYWNGPEGLRNDRRTLLPAHAVLGLALGDFNNDGVLDLFVANYSTGRARDLDSYLYWGKNPSGAESMFSPLRMTPIPAHSAAGCVAADFDGDGRVDLALANHKTCGDHLGESWVVWNGADGLDFRHPTKLPTSGPHGMFASVPGNQRDRGPEEFYISEAMQLPQGARVKSVEWDADLPPKTWVRGEIRTADSRDQLDRVEWTKAESSRGGTWVQYRLALGAAAAGTPRVREVRVTYE